MLPGVVAALREGRRLVLRAAPGAGKTTRVPATLLDAGLAAGKQVVVLEPRRIAARAAAEYVAAERGEAVGDTVGYRVRYEHRGGPRTALWFVTEGVLGRQLVRDPFLEEIGVVVLDEFHERHLQGDVALAVLCELQETVRPDLKLAVMSATLETDRLSAYLGGCPVLTSEGRVFPVSIEYEAAAAGPPASARAVAAVERLVGREDDGGDVLVFLPGAAEIRRVAAGLEAFAVARNLALVPLHGELPLEAQQRALRRGARRKIVLSTNVAETALTIDGVTAVVDSGLAREARLDRAHGINTLQVVRISRAAAEQRAGRAGRTAPGRCLRLWTQAEHAHRRAQEAPEISRLDLSATVLELRAWGARDLAAVRWLDAPDPAALEQADELLRLLGAVDAGGAVTGVGRRMLELAVPPRLGRMLVEARRRGCVTQAAVLAALASERDVRAEERAFAGGAPRRAASGPSDLLHLSDLFAESAAAGHSPAVCARLGLDRRSVLAVERARRHLERAGGRESASGGGSEADLLRCVLAGFPDRLVRRREAGGNRGVIVGGRGVTLADSSVVREAELFVAVEVEIGRPRVRAVVANASRSEWRVRTASAVERAWLEEMYPAQMRTRTEIVFDPEREAVVERRCEAFADVVLSEHLRAPADRLRAAEALAEAARRDPRRALGLGDREARLLARVEFLRRWLPEAEWPRVEELLAEAAAALCAGCRAFAELRRADAHAALWGLLSREQRALLEREAPEVYRLPTGRAAVLEYGPDKPPSVAARIQEIFGLTATPRLARGRVALVFELLAPNRRPVQITDDLDSFWRRTYPEVRKILRGRYPKHAWPENPLAAAKKIS